MKNLLLALPLAAATALVGTACHERDASLDTPAPAPAPEAAPAAAPAPAPAVNPNAQPGRGEGELESMPRGALEAVPAQPSDDQLEGSAGSATGTDADMDMETDMELETDNTEPVLETGPEVESDIEEGIELGEPDTNIEGSLDVGDDMIDDSAHGGHDTATP